MKNNLPALLFGTAMMVVVPPAAQAQSPATISLPQGGQFRLSISNTDPNMIFIPGDKVTAITAPGGMLADKRLTTAGGVLFTSVATRTFTIFVETALGQTFSVVATPVKGEGRVYRLMSAEPPSRPETRKWETAQAYEKLLISLNRAVLTGDIPDGYGEVKPLSDGIRLPGGFSVTPLKAWAGDQLRADRYELRNANTWGVALREQDFWKPGVRAVMFDNNAQTLIGGGRMTVTVIRGNGRGKMANVNKVVRRRQVALLIALVLGIGAGGAGTWMVSEMNLKKAPPAKAPKGEPAPDMTGVVNQSFDNKVQRSAIAEAQRLNKETQYRD